MTQGKRQDPSQSQGRVDGEVFGPALILGDGLPAGSEDDCADMVVLTVKEQDLTRIDDLIQESQKWDGAQLINRQIILHEGPWRDNNMAIAWELYFQAQGLAPHAWCGTAGCKKRQPLIMVTQVPTGSGDQELHEQAEHRGQVCSEAQRRQLGGFCAHCWKRVGLRTGRDDVASIDFMELKQVFKNSSRIDPKARLRGPVTENEFQKFVDNYLKNNKAPGPDGVTNECIKTMSKEELDILRMWVNEILAYDKAKPMSVNEMNGTISLLHKGEILMIGHETGARWSS